MELAQFLRVAIFFAIFGGVIGVLIGYAIRSSRGDPDRSPVRKKRESRSSIPANQDNILRIWQDIDEGPLNLALDGKIISSPGEMNERQKKRFKQLVVFLYRWMEKQETTSTKKTETSETAEKPSRPGTSSSRQPPPAEESEEADSPASFAETLPEEPSIRDAFRLSPFKRNPAPEPSASETEPVEQSIAAQIDDILQKKLENSALNDLHIKLLELPTKGMIIMVGQKRYETVDEIPDPKIKGLIKSAVKEWSSRHNRT